MKKKYFVVGGLAVIIILAVLYCLYVNNDLTVTCYKIETKLDNPLRIVQLTDLHEKEFGEDNIRLIETVKEQNPDLIVMTGDMQNKNDEDTDVVCSLIRELSNIADVYYGYGNHEKTWEQTFNKNFAEIVTDAGATVLENEYMDITVQGNELRIAGYMGYYRAVNMTADTEKEQQAELVFMDEFENTDRYKILLNHIPTSWSDWGYLDLYPVDLVFSGHYHGGQMVLPFAGPLYAPYIGFFPGNVKGLYQGENGNCILSSGLGTDYFIPRINNPPEMVTVELV